MAATSVVVCLCGCALVCASPKLNARRELGRPPHLPYRHLCLASHLLTLFSTQTMQHLQLVRLPSSPARRPTQARRPPRDGASLKPERSTGLRYPPLDNTC